MYEPLFNQVLVEIDDKEAKWGKGNDDSMLGASYREGLLLSVGEVIPTQEHHDYNPWPNLEPIVGKQIMWNEGHEAGKVFEHEGKMYALVYWWDIVGVKKDEQ